jgi:hypothetical protein
VVLSLFPNVGIQASFGPFCADMLRPSARCSPGAPGYLFLLSGVLPVLPLGYPLPLMRIVAYRAIWCVPSVRIVRVAGIFMRFYTLSHITFISNAIEGGVAQFSLASCHLAPAHSGHEQEDVRWQVGYGASMPRFPLP